MHDLNFWVRRPNFALASITLQRDTFECKETGVLNRLALRFIVVEDFASLVFGSGVQIVLQDATFECVRADALDGLELRFMVVK